MKIYLSNAAFSDLENIQEYYLGQGVGHIGDAFVVKIMAHLDRLADHPQMGRVVPETNDASIREIIHPPFRIVYLLSDSAIDVIRVWRSERLLKLSE